MSAIDQSPTLEIALEALPTDPSDKRDADALLALVTPSVVNALPDSGRCTDDRAALTRIAQSLDTPDGRMTLLSGGWSGARVWSVECRSIRYAVKFTPQTRASAFVREAATLRQLEREEAGKMGVARVLGVGFVTIDSVPTLWMAQTWCSGKGLGSYVRRLMVQDPSNCQRQGVLAECEEVYGAVGEAFADWHSATDRHLQASDRFAERLRSDIARSDTDLRAADALFGFDYERCAAFLRRQLDFIEDLWLPVGRMHIDPHYGNIRVHRKGKDLVVSMVDLGNSFYATTRNGGCGLPGFDCHLLAQVYPDLRATRGPLLNEGFLTAEERRRLGDAFWKSYVQGGGRRNTPEQAVLFDAIQCWWYLSWFPVTTYFAESEAASEDHLRKRIAIAFYIERIKNLYAA